MQCKSNPMLHYWKSPTDLPAYMAYKVNELNPGTMTTSDSHLATMHIDTIGCILLVIQDVSSNRPPIITLVVAPSMANINACSTSNPPGILLANIWANLVLQPFLDVVDMDQPHCPILAASEGFLLAIAPVTPQLYIEDAQPFLFPTGKLFSEQVTIGQGDPTYQTIFLPEICSPPLGLRWPLDIDIKAFFESITLLGCPYKPFMQTLESIQLVHVGPS
jgi:hypothetical protein